MQFSEYERQLVISSIEKREESLEEDILYYSTKTTNKEEPWVLKHLSSLKEELLLANSFKEKMLKES